MSSEFIFFLRRKPRIAQDAVAGMTFEVSKYEPRPSDPIASVPWRSEIKWEVSCVGRMTDYDEWEVFAATTCKWYDGVLWSEATGDFVELQGVSDEDELKADYREIERRRAEVAELVRRAEASDQGMDELRAALAEPQDDPAAWASLEGEVLRLAKARAPVERWGWIVAQLGYINTRRDSLHPSLRAAFARTGDLAALLVEHANAQDRSR